MIGYLRGRVLSLLPESVILDVGGVGSEVTCSGAAFSKLSGLRAGEEGEIYTYLQVGEQGVALFGFADLKEKELFLRLTSVQGVGARQRLSGHMPYFSCFLQEGWRKFAEGPPTSLI